MNSFIFLFNLKSGFYYDWLCFIFISKDIKFIL